MNGMLFTLCAVLCAINICFAAMTKFPVNSVNICAAVFCGCIAIFHLVNFIKE
jgi:hypothetical protein